MKCPKHFVSCLEYDILATRASHARGTTFISRCSRFGDRSPANPGFACDKTLHQPIQLPPEGLEGAHIPLRSSIADILMQPAIELVCGCGAGLERLAERSRAHLLAFAQDGKGINVRKAPDTLVASEHNYCSRYKTVTLRSLGQWLLRRHARHRQRLARRRWCRRHAAGTLPRHKILGREADQAGN